MIETTPGVYTGKFRFTRGDARRAYVIVKLTDDNFESVKVIPNPISVAVNPPGIIPVFPEPNRKIKGSPQQIFARFTSKGSLVDPCYSQDFT